MSDRLRPPRSHHAFVMLSQLADQLEDVASSISGHRLLDYGSGASPYRPLFSSRFDEIVTADLAGVEASIVLHDDGSIPMGDGVFDCVLSTQVLEHVPDPYHYLSEAHRVLGSEGMLVLSTHGHYRYHPDPEDYWRWTRPGLEMLLYSNSFEAVEVRPITGLAAASLTMFQQAVASRVPRPLRRVYYSVFQRVIGLVDRLFPAVDDAGVWVVVARRM